MLIYQIVNDIVNSPSKITLLSISGLDPASPLFDTFLLSNEVLDKSDALFVDVVHSNIGFKGKISPLGHLDFYANNGIAQPGCGTSNYTFLFDIGSVLTYCIVYTVHINIIKVDRSRLSSLFSSLFKFIGI